MLHSAGVAMLPMLAGFSQTISPTAAPQQMPASFERGRGGQACPSGVDDQVVLLHWSSAFLLQSSGSDITALKNAAFRPRS